jgi:transposase-like protein
MIDNWEGKVPSARWWRWVEAPRESTQSWKELLLDLKRRGLAVPEVAVADGALGFWHAIEEVWPKIRGQHCLTPSVTKIRR